MKTQKNSLSKGIIFSITTMAFLGLSACSNAEKAAPKTQEIGTVTLDTIINDDRRLASDVARDTYRNPKKTLEFFGVQPNMTIIEIWPSSYYMDIIPYYIASQLNEEGVVKGHYVAAQLPLGISERLDKRISDQQLQFESDKYKHISFTTFSKKSLSLETENADMVLSFRNVHNWMSGAYAEEAFNSFYKALKPGGILGIVEHRLPESVGQDPLAANGYVQTSYIKSLAKQAGFEFVESSDINANPKDTADHPFGVWALPPRSRTSHDKTSTPIGFDPSKYLAIGESDRASLKFRKPF